MMSSFCKRIFTLVLTGLCLAACTGEEDTLPANWKITYHHSLAAEADQISLPHPSKSGKIITFASTAELIAADTDSDSDIYQLDVDKSEFSLLTLQENLFDDASTDHELPVSTSDGQIVGYVSHTKDPMSPTGLRWHPILMDVQTGKIIRMDLPSKAGSASTVALSADGDVKVFDWISDNSLGSEIQLVTPTTMMALCEGRVSESCSSPHVSRDGSHVFFQVRLSDKPGNPVIVRRVGVSGGEVIDFVTTADANVTVPHGELAASSDGSSIAFILRSQSQDRHQIWMYDYGASRLREIPTGSVSPTGDIALSPSAQYLAFTGTFPADNQNQQEGRVFIKKLDEEGASVIADTRGLALNGHSGSPEFIDETSLSFLFEGSMEAGSPNGLYLVKAAKS